MDTKTCSRCLTDKPLAEFGRKVRNPDGLQHQCKTCHNIVTQNRRRRDVEGVLVYKAKERSVEKGVPFNLSRDDIHIPPICPVLGIPLRVNMGKWKDDSPTLDRIVPGLGYVPGNVLVISYRANRIKSDATFEELRKVAEYFSNLGISQ